VPVDFSDLNTLTLYIVLFCIFGFALSMQLLLRSGRRHAAKDIDAHAVAFPEGLKEGHGGIPAFLVVVFGAVCIWAVVYLAIHAREFAVIFAG
jgi:hypothetical protein